MTEFIEVAVARDGICQLLEGIRHGFATIIARTYTLTLPEVHRGPIFANINAFRCYKRDCESLRKP